MKSNISEEAINVLKNCTVEGMIIKLPPGQLERNIYLEIKKQLELIGGKWKGGNTQGFIYNEDPTDLLNQIANGEKRNLKKEFQFYGTPNDLADHVVKLSEIYPNHSILEPSAGQGAIVKAIHRVCPNAIVNCCELMEINQTFLSKIVNSTFICADFLKLKEVWEEEFDRIVANPPFSKNSDILHIKEMYSWLNKGGRLVSIASKHWQISKNKKETEFRKWLDSVNAQVIEVERGTFQESGTMIASVIIIIDKK